MTNYLTFMMKICSFLILLSLSFTCCRNLIRTVPVNSEGNPGIISLKKVALSVESTICMEIMIQQFYQGTSYRDQKGTNLSFLLGVFRLI